uniref:Uncharacterized protein n=1 Tax=Panagrolaimus sp. JU765 TaxID=591449 RepID=A0AC34Q0Z4_9BILA
MSLTYVIRENLNYGLNSTVYPGGNHSIDRVVDQVHDLAGEINEFSKTINKQVKNVGDHATQVIDNFESHFKNLSNGAHNIEVSFLCIIDDAQAKNANLSQFFVLERGNVQI